MKKSLLCIVMLIVFAFSQNAVFAQTGSTCALADPITSVPYSATGLVTIGTTYSSLPCSGTFPNYMSGADYVFSFTPTVTGTYNVKLTNTGYGVGVFITDLCPDAGGVVCVANNNAPTGNPSASATLTSGTPYYIIVSSVSMVSATTNFDISLQYCNGIQPVSNFTTSQNGYDITFTNTSTDATTYLWYFGDELLPFPYGAAETSSDPTHTYTAYGTYTVYLIATNCSLSDTLMMDVTLICPGTMPVGSFTYNATGATVDFTSTSTDATSWQWFFGDTDIFPLVSGSTIENPSHTYLADGTYTVNLIVTNECGSDTINTTITIVGANISTPQSATLYNSYPNPTSGTLNVNMINSNYENSTIEIINELGETVLSKNTSDKNTTLNLHGIAKGIYTLKIQSGSESGQSIIVIQ